MASNLSNKVLETLIKILGILYNFKIDLLRKFIIYFVQKKIRLKNIIWTMGQFIFLCLKTF